MPADIAAAAAKFTYFISLLFFLIVIVVVIAVFCNVHFVKSELSCMTFTVGHELIFVFPFI